MFISQAASPVCRALAGASPAQVLAHASRLAWPLGMLQLASLAVPDQQSPVMFGGLPGPLLMTSWTESLLSSKSPMRHSPKAIVLLVPSVMSRIPLGCPPLSQEPKMPLGEAPEFETTQWKLE